GLRAAQQNGVEEETDLCERRPQLVGYPRDEIGPLAGKLVLLHELADRSDRQCAGQYQESQEQRQPRSRGSPDYQRIGGFRSDLYPHPHAAVLLRDPVRRFEFPFRHESAGTEEVMSVLLSRHRETDDLTVRGVRRQDGW